MNVNIEQLISNIENDGEPGNASHEFVTLLLRNEPLKVRASSDTKRGKVAFDES